jgi:hypothetical protein
VFTHPALAVVTRTWIGHFVAPSRKRRIVPRLRTSVATDLVSIADSKPATVAETAARINCASTVPFREESGLENARAAGCRREPVA